MDINKITSAISMPKVADPTAPRREIDLQEGDEKIVYESIDKLDKSRLNTEDLFEVFNDWQTKKTLTSKRIWVSTSLLVAAASWIGVDYTELTLFGLKLSNGNPERLIAFILILIILSGIFYEVSRRIDSSVRNAKISHISRDLKELREPMRAIREVMDRNNISSFSDLYYDFKSSLVVNNKHNAVDVFRAINFYDKNLTGAGKGLNLVTIAEQLVIYLIAAYAIVALVVSFKNS